MMFIIRVDCHCALPVLWQFEGRATRNFRRAYDPCLTRCSIHYLARAYIYELSTVFELQLCRIMES
jgi:hypothetical protein